ncbi:MAG TPA: DMT family transporter [Nitrospirota bacterium]
MPDLFFFALMLVSGVFVALQPLINANLATRVGYVQSALVSFGVGTIALAGVVAALSNGNLRALPGAPWWHYTGGLLGAFFVTAIIMSVPRIGTTAALAATIASQLAAGAIFDHYGLMGGRHIPLDVWRIAGIGLLFAGAGLVLKG